MKPFRFGTQISQASNRAEWINQCRKAEDLGYSTIFMPDHFGDQLSPVPALVVAAENTSLNIAPLVLDNDYRHPVVLAKELATVALLAEGRLEVGIGAGWMKTDYDESGIDYDPPAVRVDRFEESLKILKPLLGGERVEFSGEHYNVSHQSVPAPATRPKFLIGGGGRRVLGIAGREADIVGINFDLRAGAITPDLGSDAVVEATDKKIAWVKDGAGDRFSDIELNVLVFMSAITDNPEGAVEGFAQMLGVPASTLLASPFALVGSEDEIVERIIERRERWGISYYAIRGSDIETMSGVVKRLAGK